MDLTFIKKELGTDPKMLKELTTIFKRNISEYLNIMEMALDVGDYEKIYFASHKVTPSCQMFGLEEQTIQLARIEALAKDNNNISEISVLHKEVEKRFKSILQ